MTSGINSFPDIREKMMEENNQQTIFRKETMDRISSPDQLTDYLRVTNPGVWMLLLAVLVLLAGLMAWSTVGTLETKAPAQLVVEDYRARIYVSGPGSVEAGMPLRIDSNEYTIASVDQDEYGRTIAFAEVALPDGAYSGEIILEEVHPISFLLESR